MKKRIEELKEKYKEARASYEKNMGNTRKNGRIFWMLRQVFLRQSLWKECPVRCVAL